MAQYKLIFEMADGTSKSYDVVNYAVEDFVLRFATADGREMVFVLGFIKNVTVLQIDAPGPTTLDVKENHNA
jgi:hypothetical protein